MFETPILFLIFNRPDTTIQVFESIRKQQPKYLYVAADGPRENKLGETERCEETRKLVIDNIDWPCEVKVLFRTENLGCGKAVSSAITWFFENVEEGIILEDDCLPNNQFFTFCENLLQHYENDLRIFLISGYNPLGANIKSDSYFFSQHTSVWGWATWRNRWEKYDFEMKKWDSSEIIDYMKVCLPSIGFDNYKNGFDSVKNNHIDTWDYQWAYSILIQNGLTIKPFANLITNIGITGAHASEKDRNHFVEYGILSDNLIHPDIIIPSLYEDTKFYNWNFPRYKINKYIFSNPYYLRMRGLFSRTIKLFK